jgi:adenylyltransferase/sulfurtransferase
MDEFPGITPAELLQRLEAGEVIDVIDVREIWELAITKLPFARHIRMIEVLSRLPEIPQDRPVVFFCRTGSRSMRTVEMVRLHGYTNVYNLEGGILAWAHDLDPAMPQYYI